MISIKRIYEDAEKTDGYRVLVDRLWPRGIKKESAGIDFWAKEVSPSASLRKWFDHEPEKFIAFKNAYLLELKKNEAVAELIEKIKSHKTVTLLYGAKDQVHNQAVVLRDFLTEK